MTNDSGYGDATTAADAQLPAPPIAHLRTVTAQLKEQVSAELELICTAQTSLNTEWDQYISAAIKHTREVDVLAEDVFREACKIRKFTWQGLRLPRSKLPTTVPPCGHCDGRQRMQDQGFYRGRLEQAITKAAKRVNDLETKLATSVKHTIGQGVYSTHIAAREMYLGQGERDLRDALDDDPRLLRASSRRSVVAAVVEARQRRTLVDLATPRNLRKRSDGLFEEVWDQYVDFASVTAAGGKIWAANKVIMDNWNKKMGKDSARRQGPAVLALPPTGPTVRRSKRGKWHCRTCDVIAGAAKRLAYFEDQVAILPPELRSSVLDQARVIAGRLPPSERLKKFMKGMGGIDALSQLCLTTELLSIPFPIAPNRASRIATAVSSAPPASLPVVLPVATPAPPPPPPPAPTVECVTSSLDAMTLDTLAPRRQRGLRAHLSSAPIWTPRPIFGMAHAASPADNTSAGQPPASLFPQLASRPPKPPRNLLAPPASAKPPTLVLPGQRAALGIAHDDTLQRPIARTPRRPSSRVLDPAIPVSPTTPTAPALSADVRAQATPHDLALDVFTPAADVRGMNPFAPPGVHYTPSHDSEEPPSGGANGTSAAHKRLKRTPTGMPEGGTCAIM